MKHVSKPECNIGIGSIVFSVGTTYDNL